jgi:hypothetical protein
MSEGLPPEASAAALRDILRAASSSGSVI